MGWLAQCGVRRESLRVSVPGRRPETRYWTWFRASRLKTLPFCCSYEYTGGWVGAGPGSNLAWLGHPAGAGDPGCAAWLWPGRGCAGKWVRRGPGLDWRHQLGSGQQQPAASSRAPRPARHRAPCSVRGGDSHWAYSAQCSAPLHTYGTAFDYLW